MADSAPTLGSAVAAVNEHRRQAELRRMAHLAQRGAERADWEVALPHSQLVAMEHELQQASGLRRFLDNGPLIVVCFGASPPHAVRDMPLSLSRAIGHVHDIGVRDRPLARLFVAGDAQRLRHALLDNDSAFTLAVSLRRIDGQPWPCHMHVAALDPADPEWRWACCVQPPAQVESADGAGASHRPPPTNQRPRLDGRPLQSN
jgi:hypothetical protein